MHLENYHNVYFAPGQELERVQNAALARTKLTAFFALNEANVDARQYLYHEIPLHYTWNAQHRQWRLRRRRVTRETLARMYVVNPLDRDRFHLRLLLLHRRGSRSFRDIKTVNGMVHATYAAAAVALGLLEDDEAWRACMTESSALDTAYQIRHLYVTILLFCHPTDPAVLYRRFEVNMMEDFNRRFQNVDRARAACLKAIGDLLRARGKSLDDFGLPNPDDDLLEPDQADPMFGEIDTAVAWERRLRELNDEQRTVYDRVMAAVDDNRNVSKMFYVDGPGGTGKTMLYGCLISSLRNTQRTVLSVAYTGIAASLMDGGMTVHSTFGLPLGTLTEQSTSSITMQSLRAQRIRDSSLIVWDEAPMSPALQLTVVDRLLKDVMGSALPFGGKPILLAGDFRQILPVVRRGNRSAIVMSSIKRHSLWREFQQFRLTRNMRAENDADFAAWLLQLGNGQLPSVGGITDMVDIPPQLVCDLADLTDFVYPQQMSLANVDEFARRIILCPRNEECHQMNSSVLRRVVGAQKTYYAIDTVIVDDPDEAANYPTEFLNSLHPNGLPPYALTLRVGSIVMLLRNIDPKRQLCNGTRLVVTELRRHNFKARKLSGAENAQDDIILPAVSLTSGEEDDLPFQMKRVQFPVRLSFSMTINKSQGQTFDRVGLLLTSPAFSHGQLYVAFSRARNAQSVRVGMHSDGNGRFVTKNIVYREVL